MRLTNGYIPKEKHDKHDFLFVTKLDVLTDDKHTWTKQEAKDVYGEDPKDHNSYLRNGDIVLKITVDGTTEYDVMPHSTLSSSSQPPNKKKRTALAEAMKKGTEISICVHQVFEDQFVAQKTDVVEVLRPTPYMKLRKDARVYVQGFGTGTLKTWHSFPASGAHLCGVLLEPNNQNPSQQHRTPDASARTYTYFPAGDSKETPFDDPNEPKLQLVVVDRSQVCSVEGFTRLEQYAQTLLPDSQQPDPRSFKVDFKVTKDSPPRQGAAYLCYLEEHHDIVAGSRVAITQFTKSTGNRQGLPDRYRGLSTVLCFGDDEKDVDVKGRWVRYLPPNENIGQRKNYVHEMISKDADWRGQVVAVEEKVTIEYNPAKPAQVVTASPNTPSGEKPVGIQTPSLPKPVPVFEKVDRAARVNFWPDDSATPTQLLIPLQDIKIDRRVLISLDHRRTRRDLRTGYWSDHLLGEPEIRRNTRQQDQLRGELKDQSEELAVEKIGMRVKVDGLEGDLVFVGTAKLAEQADAKPNLIAAIQYSKDKAAKLKRGDITTHPWLYKRNKYVHVPDKSAPIQFLEGKHCDQIEFITPWYQTATDAVAEDMLSKKNVDGKFYADPTDGGMNMHGIFVLHGSDSGRGYTLSIRSRFVDGVKKHNVTYSHVNVNHYRIKKDDGQLSIDCTPLGAPPVTQKRGPGKTAKRAKSLSPQQTFSRSHKTGCTTLKELVQKLQISQSFWQEETLRGYATGDDPCVTWDKDECFKAELPLRYKDIGINVKNLIHDRPRSVIETLESFISPIAKSGVHNQAGRVYVELEPTRVISTSAVYGSDSAVYGNIADSHDDGVTSMAGPYLYGGMVNLVCTKMRFKDGTRLPTTSRGKELLVVSLDNFLNYFVPGKVQKGAFIQIGEDV